MTDRKDLEERVAKRMFEAHAVTTTYGRPWDEASKELKAVWLHMAKVAVKEIEQALRSTNLGAD